MRDGSALPASRAAAPTAVEGPHGPIRLKWHKLRTRLEEAPFRRSNLIAGWQGGAALEIDIITAADQRFIVAHDATLGPSTTGRGRIAEMRADQLTGSFHRARDGRADHEAPVLPLAEFLAPLKRLPPASGTHLQLDLKVPEGRVMAEASVADAAAAVAGLENAIVIGSHGLEEARRLVAAMPGARLGYDPMRAASRDPGLRRSAERLLRHMERRRAGVSLAYLSFNAVLAAEDQGFPLVQRLLDLGIETDAWTVNPGLELRPVLHGLVEAKVRQITTDSPHEIAAEIRRL
jgi:glycerophosphoryl diester phosphodiesterase